MLTIHANRIKLRYMVPLFTLICWPFGPMLYDSIFSDWFIHSLSSCLHIKACHSHPLNHPFRQPSWSPIPVPQFPSICTDLVPLSLGSLAFSFIPALPCQLWCLLFLSYLACNFAFSLHFYTHPPSQLLGSHFWEPDSIWQDVPIFPKDVFFF